MIIGTKMQVNMEKKNIPLNKDQWNKNAMEYKK